MRKMWKWTFSYYIACILLVELVSSDNSEDDQGSNEWRAMALSEHNLLRRKHGAADLLEDSELDSVAQKHAEFLAANNLFDHSTDNDYGENLMVTSADTELDAVKDAVDSWYDEIKDYDYEKPGYKEQTGHFTTMVWKGSTHMGVGVAWNENEEQFVVVANYKPGGNVEGEYEDNVYPASE